MLSSTKSFLPFSLLLLLILFVFNNNFVFGIETNPNHKDQRQFIEFSDAQPIPEGWEQNHLSSSQQSISLIFALKQPEHNKLETIFQSVSDPDSPQYGNYLTLEQLRSIIAPRQHHIDTVQSFLEDHGIPRSHHRFTKTMDFLIVDNVSVDRVQDILAVNLYEFKHSKTGHRVIKTLEPYSLPSSVAAAVDFVGGPIRFPSTHLLSFADNHKIKRDVQRAPWDFVTPKTIRHQYNVNNATGKSPKNSQAVASFLKQYYSPSDLSKFFERNGLPVRHVDRVLGPNDASNPGIEASLDIQFLMGVGTNIRTWFVSTGGTHKDQEPFLEWVVGMSNLTDSPWVHSVSYGDIEHTISENYAQRLNSEFMKFGVRGHTVLVASGDNGARCTDGCSRFVPEWPTSSPFVTSVGGTHLVDNNNKKENNEESVYFSGGGFSNYYTMPKYQKKAVNKYLSSSACPQHSFFNTTGRAYPDVAALATNYGVVYSGSTIPVDGTSCSTPTMAALVSLLNDARLESGKRPLGFLNPLLYKQLESNPNVFHDIVKGDNKAGCCPGFKATDGWDAISGCGALNFENMVKVVTK